MEENTSTGTGATPTPVSPATGTATVGATPTAAPSLTLEEALKKIADLEHSHGNAKEELDRHRKKLSAYEKAELEQAEAKKLAEEAQLSEIERTKKQHAEIQAQHNAVLLELQETKITHAVERYAHELNFIHPEIAVRLLNRAELEFAENGTPKNAKQLLEKVLLSMPELARQSTPDPSQSGTGTAPTTPTRPGAPALPPMNVSGRSQINLPGTALPPGKPVRLADIRRRS
jgi:hypothetical protein